MTCYSALSNILQRLLHTGHVIVKLFVTIGGGVGALPKIGMEEHGHLDPLFFNSLAPIDPRFNNSIPFLDNFLPTFLATFLPISFQISKFYVKNVSKFVLCKENLPKLVTFSPFKPHFGGQISQQKTLSFELLSEHPGHFQS